MRILVTGAAGRVGQYLVNLLKSQNHAVTGIDIDNADITKRTSVDAIFNTVQPEIVLHCAALTAVDHCAEHPDEALEVNAYGTQNIALASQKCNATLVHISTNEVFDGRVHRDILEYDQPHAINAYGYSKLVAEQIVRDLMPKFYIVRASWLFAHGGINFLQTILSRAQAGQPIRVVTNEVSSPTYTNDFGNALVQLINTEQYGIYHLVNEGHTSRYNFARYALDLAGYSDTMIEPIALAEFKRASRPPEYAVLRNMAAARLGIVLRPWQDAVKAFLAAENVLKD